MKKIGEGWQYSVYDLQNDRVLKKFHSLPKMYWVIIKTIFPFNVDPFWKIPSFARSMKKKALNSFQTIKEKQIPESWFGNPKFINSLDFEQDKKTPLHSVLEKCSVSEAKAIIDKFIIFNKKLLAKGIIDKSFNITKNFALSKNGEVILIDLGELFADQERINEQIKSRAWAAHYVADCINNAEVRSYFLSEMDKEFGSVVQ